MKDLYLTVVIPAYNEETNIRLGALDKVARYLESQKYSWEVIIVNDGSDDGTALLIREFALKNTGFHVINNPHRGKAATIISGVSAAKGSLILFSDLDQATPLKETEKIFPWFSRGYDVVIGSRRGERAGAPMFRKIMAKGFMMLRSNILGLRGISDTQCGFKSFKREVALNIFRHLSLYGHQETVSGAMVTAGFDIEVLFVARLLGYTIKEVPVEWHYVETRRVSPIKDSWEGFLDILRIRINEWKGLYSTRKNSQ